MILRLANDWQGDTESGSEIKEEQFVQRIRNPISISMSTRLDIEFCFGDDNMLWGHIIVVSFDETAAFERADIEG